MTIRLGIVGVLFWVLAFAPAPFPRPNRGQREVTLGSLQGLWRVTGGHVRRGGGKREPFRPSYSYIRIEGDRWSFLSRRELKWGSNWVIALDHTHDPARLSFYHDRRDLEANVPRGVGLAQRRGNEVQVLYTWDNAKNRPRAFDPPPEGHCWIITLQKEASR